MPFFLRHYLTISDRVVVQDCGSVDGTMEMVRGSGATLIPTGAWGMDERRRRDDSQEFVEYAAGKCEWVIAVDADEFVLGDFDRAFADGARTHCDVLHTVGWTMTGDGFPVDDGRQIYQISPTGIKAGAAKPIIVRPGSKFLWSSGRHFIETPETRVAEPLLHLLHYRYLGYEYTKQRNARNYERSVEKLTAHTCSPNYKGAESANEVAKHAGKGGNVMDAIARLGYSAESNPFAPHLQNCARVNPES